MQPRRVQVIAQSQNSRAPSRIESASASTYALRLGSIRRPKLGRIHMAAALDQLTLRFTDSAHRPKRAAVGNECVIGLHGWGMTLTDNVPTGIEIERLAVRVTMETYPLDIAADQVVQWLIDEERIGHREFQVSATRSYVLIDITSPEARGLGEEEREDLTEIMAIGTLEIAPQHKAEGWLLRVRVEDPLGRRLPDYVAASDVPEEIGMSSFRDEFLLPGRGTAFVAVDADREQSWLLFQNLLDQMRANKHLA